MPEEQIDLWRQVYLNERTWASPHADHKMGWLRPGNIVWLVRRYGENWYKIDYEASTVPELKAPTPQYPHHWVMDNDLGLFGPIVQPEPEPEPEPPALSIIEWFVLMTRRFFQWLLDLP